MKTTIKVGDRVRLPEIKEESIPSEDGKVIEIEGRDMCVVLIDKKYRLDESDDGLREVMVSDCKLLKKK